MKYRVFLICAALFSLLTNELFTQNEQLTGVISGVVIDSETRQPLQSASIRIPDTKFGAISNRAGEFTIENVPIGRYTIQAKMLGYEIQTLSDIVVVTKRTTQVEFELQISSVMSDEIVVESKYFDNSSAMTTISSTTIANEEIRITPGMPDVFRRMSYAAGIGRTSESSSAMVVRGGDPEENLTLIENIEINSPFHFSSISGEIAGSMSIIEPKLIKNVTVSTGGFEAQYGDKLSSVTEILLKEPDNRRINGDISLDLGGISGFVNGPVTEDLSFMIAGRRGVLEFVLSMMDEDFIPITTDLHFKSVYKPSQNHSIEVYGLFAGDEMEGSHEDNLSDAELVYSDLSKNQGAVGVNWKWLVADNAYIVTTPYFQFTDWELLSGPEDNKDAHIDMNKETNMGIKSEMYYRINPQLKFLVGAEFKNVSAEYSDRSDWDTLSNGTVIEPYLIEFGPEYSYKLSSYVQTHWSPLAWMNISAGVREDYFEYIDKFTFSPRVSANIVLAGNLNLNLAYGSFYQFPQFYRIFTSPLNAGLQPAKAIHYIAGLEYYPLSDMQIKVEGYYKDISDLPVSRNDTSKLFLSTGEGYSYGVEASVNQRMSQNFFVMLNYTYSVSQRKDFEDEELYDFRYDRPHTFNLMGVYRLGDWWEFGLTTAYSTGFPYTPYDLSTRRMIDGEWYADEGEKNSERYPDYFRIDIKIQRRWVFSSWNLSAYIDFWNITNHKNIFEWSYSDGYAKKEGTVLFPFMPIIGIAAEF